MTRRVHDFARPRWGWAVSLVKRDGRSARVEGHGLGLASLDILRLPTGERAQILKVSYHNDPPDMFVAKCDLLDKEGATP